MQTDHHNNPWAPTEWPWAPEYNGTEDEDLNDWSRYLDKLLEVTGWQKENIRYATGGEGACCSFGDRLQEMYSSFTEVLHEHQQDTLAMEFRRGNIDGVPVVMGMAHWLFWPASSTQTYDFFWEV